MSALEDIPITEATSRNVYRAARDDGHGIIGSLMFALLTPLARGLYEYTQEEWDRMEEERECRKELIKEALVEYESEK